MPNHRTKNHFAAIQGRIKENNAWARGDGTKTQLKRMTVIIGEAETLHEKGFMRHYLLRVISGKHFSFVTQGTHSRFAHNKTVFSANGFDDLR